MVTLYLSQEQSLLKIFSIPKPVSFFIPKMNFLTSQLLIEEEIEIIIKDLNKVQNFWEDGKKTAGSHASKVKKQYAIK